MEKIPEYMIRVKLPDSSHYAACPSGDTEYDEAYKKAIFDAKPDGFEVKWPRRNEKWAMDSEGYTLVPLKCTDEKVALARWMRRCQEQELQLLKLKTFLKENGYV